MKQKDLENMKNDLCANPIVQQCSLQKKQQLLLTPLKSHWRGSFARRTSSHICIEKVDSSGAKLLQHRAGSTGNCVCGHKIEAIPSWRTIYPTDGPQTIQISLCTRQGDPEDSINQNHKMGNSFHVLRL